MENYTPPSTTITPAEEKIIGIHADYICNLLTPQEILGLADELEARIIRDWEAEAEEQVEQHIQEYSDVLSWD